MANVSYGTNYLKRSMVETENLLKSTMKSNYEEPLFAFVPSVGISALNNCPSSFKKIL